MNWIQFWAAVRAPLEQIDPAVPWVALAMVAFLVELAIGRYIVPALSKGGWKAWRKSSAGPGALIILLCLGASPVLEGCGASAVRTSSHLASNSATEALAWLDAKVAGEYEAASERKVAELEAAGGTVEEWEAWDRSSGLARARAALKVAYGAQKLLVSHLDGTEEASPGRLRKAFAVLSDAVRVAILELEAAGVAVPEHITKASEEMSKLGGLL